MATYKENKSGSIKESIVVTLLAMKDCEKIREKEASKLAESIAYYLADGQA
jgi:hypothetical protein